MSDRFFCSDGLADGKVTLTGTEAHHLLHVLRAQTGARVELFDGRGQVAQGVVAATGRKHAEVEVEECWDVPPIQGPTLLTAIPKGDRFRWLVEKATELGVARLIPLSTARSVVSPRESKLQKMEQTVIAACKQSGRNWLMEITEVAPLATALEGITEGYQLLAAQPGGRSLSALARRDDRQVYFVIGPEGGFTEEEDSQLQSSQATSVSLGETILRTETAAIACAAWYRLMAGD